MTRTITIEHGGQTYYGTLATIDKTMLGYEDHGILTAYLHCSWPGSGIGVGGYCLDQYDKSAKKRVATAYGLDLLVQIMRTVGVDSWEKLPGRQVIILFDSQNSLGSMAKGIAHVLDDDKMLIFSELVTRWFEAQS